MIIKQEPDFSKLEQDLKDMLKEKYPKYYKRIEKIGAYKDISLT